jgi:hypothetical protein
MVRYLAALRSDDIFSLDTTERTGIIPEKNTFASKHSEANRKELEEKNSTIMTTICTKKIQPTKASLIEITN